MEPALLVEIIVDRATNSSSGLVPERNHTFMRTVTILNLSWMSPLLESSSPFILINGSQNKQWLTSTWVWWQNCPAEIMRVLFTGNSGSKTNQMRASNSDECTTNLRLWVANLGSRYEPQWIMGSKQPATPWWHWDFVAPQSLCKKVIANFN